MKKYLAVAVVAMVPIHAMAQTQPIRTAAPDADTGSGAGKSIAVAAGIIGGLVAADLLTGGALTGPLLERIGLRVAAAPAAVVAGPPVMTPALREARSAGAVIGEMITPATNARDVAARRDLAYVGKLAVGGVLGGWLASHFIH